MINNNIEPYEWDNYEKKLTLEDETNYTSNMNNGHPEDTDYE